MNTDIQNTKLQRANNLKIQIMNQELFSAIKKVLPARLRSKALISYKHFFGERRLRGGIKDVSCCIVCDIDGEKFYDKSFEATKKKAWRRCIEFIVDRLSNRSFRKMPALPPGLTATLNHLETDELESVNDTNESRRAVDEDLDFSFADLLRFEQIHSFYQSGSFK